MDAEVGFALAAGVLAGLAMAVPALVAGVATGRPVQLDARRWATIWRTRLPPAAAGTAVHLALSAVVGVAYAVAFDALGATDGLLLWGALGGLVHWLIGGLVLTVLATAARPADGPFAPGPYALGLGRAEAAVFFLAHLAYGAAFGTLYASLLPGGGAHVVL